MILEIDKNNCEHISLLLNFIDSLGSSQQSFRYFSKRPVSVIKDHICTVLLIENSRAIGYAHLDKEDECIWLGIAMSDGHTGKGHGNELIRFLINRAEICAIDEIKLTVDEANVQAINLYRKHGFELLKKSDKTLFYHRKSTKREII
jgi:RimJ/RimL family protein N-acetyltransferase